VRQHHVVLPDPFPPGARKLAFVEGRQILIFNIADRLVAVENSCPHAGASLFGGKLEGSVLRCPSHGLKFELDDRRPDSNGGLRRFKVEREGAGAAIEFD
jgi:3-phenylpropionate/trans-cinnamate dioxygenase ferredoxin component